MFRSDGENSYAFVGSYIPRRCGIGTFTSELSEAIAQHDPQSQVFVVAMNDIPQGYQYSPRVRFEIRQSVQADYRLAAEFLNVHQVSAVSLQHEYGIFGGECGSNLLVLLKRLRRPMIATLHTILKEPAEAQRLIIREIANLSDRLVVLSEVGGQFLRDIYRIPANKITFIPHGIPDMPFVDPNFYKDLFGVEGQKVLLTFGLLSPGKGLEYVIDALPEIVRKHPDLTYIILGATHPQVKRDSGEEYRNSLYRRATALGVARHVQFQNRFVDNEELKQFLGCADIYLTPYLNEAQVCSGTLAYAMGAGKAVVSTPYWHAQEMLAEGRGRLVPFQNAHAIAEQVLDLLDNETERHALRKRAYNYTRRCTFKNVAMQYAQLFEEARESWPLRYHASISVPQNLPERPMDLPEIDLRHLRLLTDSTGLIQHCVCSTPDRRFGYCTDDNARALIVVASYWQQTHDPLMIPLMQLYLSYLLYAMNDTTGRFRNFMNYDRSWMEENGSDDSHARALWGLAMAVAMCPHDSMITLASQLFLRGLRACSEVTSPRAWAFAILGIHAYLRRFGGDSEVRRFRAVLIERLERLFKDHACQEWYWCEDTLSYSNAALPQAMIMSGRWMNRQDLVELGLNCLTWLVKLQTSPEGMLTIVGNDGWCGKNGARARFDQQPIEAHALIEACIEAYHVTHDKLWADRAHMAFAWFLGQNDLRLPLYDFTTGGCRDGLQVDRVNQNQGAESTLSWLMSLLLMHDLQMEQALGQLASAKLSEPAEPAEPIKASGSETPVPAETLKQEV